MVLVLTELGWNQNAGYGPAGKAPAEGAFASLGYDPGDPFSTPVVPPPVPPPAYISADELFSALIVPVSEGSDIDADGNESADLVPSEPSGGVINRPGPPPPNSGNI